MQEKQYERHIGRQNSMQMTHRASEFNTNDTNMIVYAGKAIRKTHRVSEFNANDT